MAFSSFSSISPPSFFHCSSVRPPTYAQNGGVTVPIFFKGWKNTRFIAPHKNAKNNKLYLYPMLPINFHDPEYLKNGSCIQKRIFSILMSSQLFSILKKYHPVLVGTFPLNIATKESDLDIACFSNDLLEFETFVRQNLGNKEDFSFKQVDIRKKKAGIANFKLEGFPVELFAQAIPVNQQDGYRHMIIEWELLQYYGDAFRSAILELKASGIKTEPAFAQLLHLDGDPYESLLAFKIKNNGD